MQSVIKFLVLLFILSIAIDYKIALASRLEYDYHFMNKTSLKFEDGREVKLKRLGDEDLWSLMLLNRKKHVVWRKNYSQAFDALWNTAFFIKIKNNSYIYDLNHDGYPEVALTVHCGGMRTITPIITFSIKGNRLEVYKVFKEYPFEGQESLFQFLASSSAERTSKKVRKNL